ncbi:MAG: hypothetical protein SGJ19_23335 [Planctomycetia bacterium]|nr:hypothetical protein [Planctomycetia bacterium]
MKPKFSILTLLGITAYVAVAIAGVVSPVGHYVGLGLWAVGTLMVFVVATGVASDRVIFSRGFVAGSTWGLLMLMLNLTWESHFYEAAEALRRMLTSPIDSRTIELNLMQFSVTCIGLLTGYLALWHYRWQERRAKKEKSGE